MKGTVAILCSNSLYYLSLICQISTSNSEFLRKKTMLKFILNGLGRCNDIFLSGTCLQVTKICLEAVGGRLYKSYVSCISLLYIISRGITPIVYTYLWYSMNINAFKCDPASILMPMTLRVTQYSVLVILKGNITFIFGSATTMILGTAWTRRSNRMNTR